MSSSNAAENVAKRSLSFKHINRLDSLDLVDSIATATSSLRPGFLWPRSQMADKLVQFLSFSSKL